MNRKLLLMVTQSGVGLVIGGLAVLALFDLAALVYIYLAAALLGILQGLNQPARVTVLSDLMDERTLLDAVAHFNAAVHIGRIVGPFLIGEMIDLWGDHSGPVRQRRVLRVERSPSWYSSAPPSPVRCRWRGSPCYETW